MCGWLWCLLLRCKVDELVAEDLACKGEKLVEDVLL